MSYKPHLPSIQVDEDGTVRMWDGKRWVPIGRDPRPPTYPPPQEAKR